VTVSCGRTPPVWGSRPLSRARRASSARASARRWLPLRASLASTGRARGSRAASSSWPASGSKNPSTATIPSKVGASHTPRRVCRRSSSRSVPSGSAARHRWAMTRRSRGGSSRRAASTSTGSASAVTGSERSWVPWASTRAWAHAEFPADQGLAGRGERTTEHGPGRPHKASRSASTQAQPGAQPSGGRANLLPLVSPGNAAGIDGRELLEPVAFQAVHQSPQGQHLLGQHRISQPVYILRGQVLDGCCQRGQLVWASGRELGCLADRMCVRVHGGNLSSPPPNASTNLQSGDNFTRAGGRSGSSPARPVKVSLVPGERMGPDPPCQVRAWGPRTPGPEPAPANRDPTVPGTAAAPAQPVPRRPQNRSRLNGYGYGRAFSRRGRSRSR
jgi:hypothetical protein